MLNAVGSAIWKAGGSTGESPEDKKPKKDDDDAMEDEFKEPDEEQQDVTKNVPEHDDDDEKCEVRIAGCSDHSGPDKDAGGFSGCSCRQGCGEGRQHQ